MVSRKMLCLTVVVALCLSNHAVIQETFTILNLAINYSKKDTFCRNNSQSFNGEYCQNAIYSIWFDSILLGGGVITLIVPCIIFYVYVVIDEIFSTVTTNSGSDTLQTIFEKNIEIYNLQRQLNNRRNHRSTARVVPPPYPPPPPPNTGRANERTPVLPGRKSPDYQAVQYATFPVIDN